MAFSLFGKKPPPPKVQKPARPGAGARPAASQDSQPAPPDDAPDLDFTNWAPPGGVAAKPADTTVSRPPAPATPAAPPAIDFGGLPGALPSAPGGPAAPPKLEVDFGALPGAEPAPGGAAEPPPSRPRRPGDSILEIEVEGSTQGAPTAIEEAAILYANGQGREALTRLESAITGEDLGAWKIPAWLMLFDLYQHLGMRKEFEDKTIDFAVKFERSPPAWQDTPPSAREPSALRTGGSAHVGLNGVLSAASAAQMEKLIGTAGRHPKIRFDASKLGGLDGAGCKLLYDAILALRAKGKEVYFTGEAQLIKLIRDIAPTGDRSVDPVAWLLLLELYQMNGQQEVYEDAAVEYAVTYEISPPAWENRPTKKLAAASAVAEEEEVERNFEEGFPIDGELAGPSDRIFAEFEVYAAQANPVLIDMRNTKRVDFVNAGELRNRLAKLKAAGKQVEIRGASEMIAALLSMLGLREVARVVPRK